MYRSTYSLLIALACVIGLACTDETENSHPIVGTWETTDPTGWEDVDLSRYLPPGNDYGYSGTWRFEKDRSYHLEYSSVSDGWGEGYALGTYDFISDSIMTIHQIESKSDGGGGNYAYGDTLHIVLKDSRLVTTRVDSFTPFTFGDESFYWQRVLQ